MKYAFLFIFFWSITQLHAQDFLKDQLKYSRVREAKNSKQDILDDLYDQKGANKDSDLFIRIFKLENRLEVWFEKNDGEYALLKTFKICYISGYLGPKRVQGDFQVPEGVYYINNFNPSSTFHLSMQINYPNRSDIIRSDKKRPGNLIFIHGDCVSAGCVSIQDEPIKELYLLCVNARNTQKKIPVHIFPFRMSLSNCSLITKSENPSLETLTLWSELLEVFRYFESNKKIPSIGVSKDGVYKINKP